MGTPGTLLLNARMRGAHLDATDEWLLGTIDRVGWAVIAVHGGDAVFSYTVGLSWSFGAPEVLMTGIGPDVARTILNDLAARVRDGAPLVAGPVAGLLQGGIVLELVATDPALANERAAYAGWLARHVARGAPAEPPAVLQLAWPDRDGRFPWDVTGHRRRELLAAQPLALALPPSGHP